MEDPLKKLYRDIIKNINQLGDMIVWIAERTLTAKEFKEFIDRFSDKPAGERKGSTNHEK